MRIEGLFAAEANTTHTADADRLAVADAACSCQSARQAAMVRSM